MIRLSGHVVAYDEVFQKSFLDFGCKVSERSGFTYTNYFVCYQFWDFFPHSGLKVNSYTMILFSRRNGKFYVSALPIFI